MKVQPMMKTLNKRYKRGQKKDTATAKAFLVFTVLLVAANLAKTIAAVML